MQQCVRFAAFSAVLFKRSFWKKWVFASGMGQLSSRCRNPACWRRQVLFLSPKRGRPLPISINEVMLPCADLPRRATVAKRDQCK